MAKLRVLVVEDSLTIRRQLCEILAADSEIEVVGEAEDGKRAIELCRDLRPNVITLDMILPVMSGLAATEYIMAHFPTPILIVSASTNRGELFKTYDALAAGAVDVLEKPTGNEVSGTWERQFISAVKIVSRIKVITHPRARLRGMSHTVAPHVIGAGAGMSPRGVRAVAIGASTGGPGALLEILRALPHPLTVPVFMLIHIDDPFSSAFADWLSDQTPHHVVFAREGDPVSSHLGKVTLAPSGRHLVIADGHFRLTMDPERHSCRPSVDVLFESLAPEYGNTMVAALLTGMGRDGAIGLLAIRRAGGLTIAQDEASSVVYGMPREAAMIGAAERILPLSEIGPSIAAAMLRVPSNKP